MEKSEGEEGIRKIGGGKDKIGEEGKEMEVEEKMLEYMKKKRYKKIKC